jgi:hypothetical protein
MLRCLVPVLFTLNTFHPKFGCSRTQDWAFRRIAANCHRQTDTGCSDSPRNGWKFRWLPVSHPHSNTEMDGNSADCLSAILTVTQKCMEIPLTACQPSHSNTTGQSLLHTPICKNCIHLSQNILPTNSHINQSGPTKAAPHSILLSAQCT